MKMVKSLILGSAAGLLAMGGAQAADLPVKAKAVEYVRICSLYGAGFFYIPGTDTCVKLGGYLRADLAVNGSDFSAFYSGAGGQFNRTRNEFVTRARETLDIDTRTATEYGVLRTFANLNFSWTSGDAIGGSSVGVYHAFIQFAGFTMGRTISIFDAPWVNYPANNFDSLVGGSGAVTGTNQFTYTAQFGNGVSASVSAQDQTAYYQTNIWNTSGGSNTNFAQGALGTQSIGGQIAPDLVGMVRVDQAWGLFQASVAAHDNHTSYYTASNETSGHPTDKWGWAGQLSLSIKNIPTGPGDTINIQGAYANGASRYVFHSLVPTAFAMYSNSAIPANYQSLGAGGVSDATFAGVTATAGSQLELTTTYGFRGGYTHNWNPNWDTSLYGAWAAVRYSGNAKANICAPIGIVPSVVGGATACNPDFNIWQIGTKTGWTPVKGLTFSGDVVYSQLNQKNVGSIALPGIGTKPAGTYDFKDQNTWTFLARAQRNW